MTLAIEPNYWVWHRRTPLTEKETRSLDEQGVRTLYWHAGTLIPTDAEWRLRGQFELPPPDPSRKISVAPVLRLAVESPHLPLGDRAAISVTRALLEAARRAGASEVQIDFDCPDRRIGEYATFLGQCRLRLAPLRLSATALAGWSRLQDFDKLAGNVDLLMPMFYDLQADAPADVRQGRFWPLLGTPDLTRQIESWRKCPVPWLAGLPNFARVSIFDRQGSSRGHLRAWEWDSLTFNPHLQFQAKPAPGVTVFRTGGAAVLANTPLAADEMVVCRWPDLAQLSGAAQLATQSGAAGIVVFRLPGEGPQGGWSLDQLGTLWKAGSPGREKFSLRRTANGLELTNISRTDLPPRLVGEGDRGWQLELDCPEGAIFREAGAGEFAQVMAHADPAGAEPKLAPVALSRRLTFWFADLKAGQSRQTGLVQLARDTNWSSLRWRIPGSAETQWQSIE